VARRVVDLAQSGRVQEQQGDLRLRSSSRSWRRASIVARFGEASKLVVSRSKVRQAVITCGSRLVAASCSARRPGASPNEEGISCR
jgi:hypothetical protein